MVSLSMISSMWQTKFCYLWFILTYPIDLICLAFAVNGGRCQDNWRTPIVWDLQLFHIIFLPILKILFVYLELLKILKDPFKKNFPIVAPEISQILFTFSFIFSYSESFMCPAWMVKKFEFWRTPFWCPKFCPIWSFLLICLRILKLWCV